MRLMRHWNRAHCSSRLNYALLICTMGFLATGCRDRGGDTTGANDVSGADVTATADIGTDGFADAPLDAVGGDDVGGDDVGGDDTLDNDVAGVDAGDDVATGTDAQDAGSDTGADASGTTSPVVLNEIVAKAANAGPDWVELFNPSGQAIDIGGFALEDDGQNRWVVPAATLIAAGGYFVVDGDTLGFGIGGDDAITLLAPDETVIDSTDWQEGDAPEGGSWGRLPNGTGAFQTLATPTEGAANEDGTAPTVPDVVLNEVVAKAADGGDDQVELYNRDSEDADVSGFGLTDAGGGSYIFPEGTTVPAGGYLTIDETTLGFGLGKDDGLTLTTPEAAVVDQTSWIDGDAPEGGSWGRFPNGTGAFKTLLIASIGAENTDDEPNPCGDGICEAGESCGQCEADCGMCASGCAADLFISEYIEGGSNNKAIEVVNVTGATVDLTGYELWRIANGGDWTEGATNKTALTGTLAHGDVFVACHSSATPAILAVCDASATAGATNFNGDDAIGLAKDGVLIDVVGQEGDAPSGGWTVIGVAEATQDHTLRRRDTINAGNTDWSASANAEWLVYDKDTLDDLGTHTSAVDCTPVVEPGPATVVVNEVVAKAPNDGDDWVELLNTGASAADLTGWTLEDDGGSSYAFPDATELAPGAYLVVMGADLGFGIGKDDGIFLKDDAGTVVSSLDWNDGDADEGASFGLLPDGTGTPQTLTTPTQGAANTAD